MANPIVNTSNPALNRSLTRAQSVAIFVGFGALLIVLALFVWFHQSNGTAEAAPVPVAMPAVISQGEEEPTPALQPTPSSHEEAVRQETLQAMKDKASAAPIEN